MNKIIHEIFNFKPIFFVLHSLFFLSFIAQSQTLHVVEVNPNRTYVPSDLTVNVGDIVKWVNLGGFHDVVADDGSFTSGSPSSSNWVFEVSFIVVGNKRYYCTEHGSPGGIGMSGIVRVIDPTGISETNNLKEFNLSQNHPNPFNPGTNIQYTIGSQQYVSLKVYDVLGNEVATLVNEEKSAGTYNVAFSVGQTFSLSSGVYLYTLRAGDFSSTRKFVLMK